MTCYRSDSRRPLRLFVCGQPRDLKLIAPVISSQVLYSAAIIHHHRNIKAIWHRRGVAEEQVPVVAAKPLNLRAVTTKLKAVCSVDVVVNAILCRSTLQLCRFDLSSFDVVARP